MKLILITLVAVVVGLMVACSSTDIEATVEARLGQERAIEATVEARVKVNGAQASEPTATPRVVRVIAAPTVTPTPKPTATRVRPTWTPVPIFRPATPTTIPTPTYAPPSPIGVWEVSFTIKGDIHPGMLWKFYNNGIVCTHVYPDDYSCYPGSDDWTWKLHGSSIVIEKAIDCGLIPCTTYTGTFSRETMSGDRNLMDLVYVDGLAVPKLKPECCWNALRIK